MARENAEVPEQVKAWRGHCGDEPDHEVVGLEKDRAEFAALLAQAKPMISKR